jgi:Lrp/AsnC family transcriptional regulator
MTELTRRITQSRNNEFEILSDKARLVGHMNGETAKIDDFDMRILNSVQKDADLSQRELAEAVGLSQNACWRRLQRLQSLGLIGPSHTAIDLKSLGFDLTVFVMIRTRHHSKDWSDGFRAHVERLPEVIDFYRIGGDWDYLIKVVTRGMSGYDAFYQKLITDFDLATVTGFFSMEAIINGRPVDLMRLRA